MGVVSGEDGDKAVGRRMAGVRYRGEPRCIQVGSGIRWEVRWAACGPLGWGSSLGGAGRV